jgi:hypothetical protein
VSDRQAAYLRAALALALFAGAGALGWVAVGVALERV